MNTFRTKLEESKDEIVVLFTKGGMMCEGKVTEVDAETVTLEVKANTERSAFSGGNDLRKITVIHATFALDSILRLDRMATAKPSCLSGAK
jgi:hypothetical protein